MYELICKSCRGSLGEVEDYMYGGVCENCERLNHERIQAWRDGADDDFMDMFWRNFVPHDSVH